MPIDANPSERSETVMAREEKVWEYAMDAGFTPLEDLSLIHI